MPSLPDVLILCGGMGTRLRGVTGSSPKALATIAGRPFLELLLRQIERHGFRRVILAVGYQSTAIREHFGSSFGALSVVYSEESSPLGTGGAVRNALPLIRSELVLITNGDSYTNADLGRFVIQHNESNADGSIVLVPSDGRKDCGLVLLNEAGTVTRFVEKGSVSASGHINAGIYLLATRLIGSIPEGRPVSMENEMFPLWVSRQIAMRGYLHEGSCLDIGTPDRFHNAQDLLRAAEVP